MKRHHNPSISDNNKTGNLRIMEH